MIRCWLPRHKEDGAFVTPDGVATLAYQEALKFSTELDCNKFCAGTDFETSQFELEDAQFIGVRATSLAPDFVAKIDATEPETKPKPEPPTEPEPEPVA